MNTKPAPHLEFAPPAQPGMGRSWVVAGVAHMALFVALGVATSWKTKPQTLQAEAELWSAVPIAAAPRLQEPTPPPPSKSKPEPLPKPPPAPKPVPPKAVPQPEPDNTLREAQIALEQKKKQEQKKQADAQREREALAKKKADELQAAKDKAAREKAAREKAALEKAAREKQAQEKKKAEEKAKVEAAEKKRQLEAAEKAKALEEAKAAEEAEAKAKAQADAFRQENLARTQGLAGASGGPKATGTALRSSGPSASYAGRLIGRIKPNITFPGDLAGNPRAEVEVRVAPDGTIISRRIAESSGSKAWDDAVLRAIDKTEILPKDTDGRVPPLIVLGFRPLD